MATFDPPKVDATAPAITVPDRKRNEDGVPVRFPVRVNGPDYQDEAVLHNDNDPCEEAPEPPYVGTTFEQVPTEGKTLCEDCEWPARAGRALEVSG
jgi:hypothetical protein